MDSSLELEPESRLLQQHAKANCAWHMPQCLQISHSSMVIDYDICAYFGKD
jgi:hypothetical protein